MWLVRFGMCSCVALFGNPAQQLGQSGDTLAHVIECEVCKVKLDRRLNYNDGAGRSLCYPRNLDTFGTAGCARHADASGFARGRVGAFQGALWFLGCIGQLARQPGGNISA